jgi:hypothetical protein
MNVKKCADQQSVYLTSQLKTRSGMNERSSDSVGQYGGVRSQRLQQLSFRQSARAFKDCSAKVCSESIRAPENCIDKNGLRKIRIPQICFAQIAAAH